MKHLLLNLCGATALCTDPVARQSGGHQAGTHLLGALPVAAHNYH